jgi:hypothetical protein
LEKYQGKGKRHLPGVLLGDMGIETFTFSPMDAALIEQAKFSREEIFGIFGVPMTFVEISAARAEAEAHQWLYAKYTLSPRLKRFEQTLNERLVPMFDPTERLFLAFDDCVPENEQFELDEEDRRLRNWSITVNQARAARGEDPVEWGDMPLNYNNGLPILTEPQLPPLFPPSGREPQKPGNERKPNDGKPNEDDGQNNDGDQGKGVYCPHCKRYHAKAMPPMTDREAEIHKLAMGWRQGMREEVLSNVGDGD